MLGGDGVYHPIPKHLLDLVPEIPRDLLYTNTERGAKLLEGDEEEQTVIERLLFAYRGSVMKILKKPMGRKKLAIPPAMKVILHLEKMRVLLLAAAMAIKNGAM